MARCQIQIQREIHQLGPRALKVHGVAVPRVSTSTLQQTVDLNLMVVLVTPDPVKTVSSNSFLSKLLTDGASYSHGSWTKADRTRAASSIREESVSLIQCSPRGEEEKSPSCKHPIPCCSGAWGCLFSAAAARERAKQIVRLGEGNPSFLRLPQPRGTRDPHATPHCSPSAFSRGQIFPIFLRRESIMASKESQVVWIQFTHCCNPVHRCESRLAGCLKKEFIDVTSTGSRFTLCCQRRKWRTLLTPESRQLDKNHSSTYSRSGKTGRWNFKSQWGGPSPLFSFNSNRDWMT